MHLEQFAEPRHRAVDIADDDLAADSNDFSLVQLDLERLAGSNGWPWPRKSCVDG
jgi:hypothetical protein